MRFLIDECLHESIVVLAHAAGFEAIHVNHLGLSGQPDWALAERIVKDEFTFVTNNRVDFIQLFGKMEVHPGPCHSRSKRGPSFATGSPQRGDSVPHRARLSQRRD